MPVPEPPASGLDLIEAAESQAATAGRLSSEAISILQSGPQDTASAFLGMALLEHRDAVHELWLALRSAKALVQEGVEIGRAMERSAVTAEAERRRARVRLARRPVTAR
jgi:hypothetical protein